MGLHTLIEDTLYSLLHGIWPKQQLRSNQSSIADTCPAGSQFIMCWEATTSTLLLCVQALQAGVPAVLAAPSLLATAASALGPGLPLILLQQLASGRRKLKKPQTSCKDDPQVTTTPLHHPPLAPSFLPPSPPPHHQHANLLHHTYIVAVYLVPLFVSHPLRHSPFCMLLTTRVRRPIAAPSSALLVGNGFKSASKRTATLPASHTYFLSCNRRSSQLAR